MQACFHGDPDEVRALLYKKEDVNYQVDSYHVSYCECTIEQLNSDCVSILLKTKFSQ